MSTIMHVVGTRPNFIKMAPVVRELAESAVHQTIVHTGQHYDTNMSDKVLIDLEFPEPDFFLGVGSGSHGEQIGRILASFERLLIDHRPRLVVVAGDVNSTFACAFAASRLGIGVAHVEAGLRSFDWSMPEEANRVLTDRLSSLLFTHSPEAAINLDSEGIPSERVHLVGNTMIDSLTRLLPRARERGVWARFGLDAARYVLVTLHRPSNVDDPDRLAHVVAALAELATRYPVVFPVHPRTARLLRSHGLSEALNADGVVCTEPMSYIDFLSLELGAGAVVTDSGGVQEETSALGVACYTLRANTERPVTISLGTNTLLGDDPAALRHVQIVAPAPAPVCSIPLWDGNASRRLSAVLLEHLATATPQYPLSRVSQA